MIDGIDHAMPIAEPRRVSCSGFADGIPADMNAHLYCFVQKLRFDQGIHLSSLLSVAGLVWKAHIIEQAVGMIEEVLVQALDEILGGRGGFRMAAHRRNQECAGESIFQKSGCGH